MCGIFGVFGSADAASITVAGLHALQHRAHDFGGIITFDQSNKHRRRRGSGLITKIIDKESLGRLPGEKALGHIRYPTVEDDDNDDVLINVQPLRGTWNHRQVAIAHNGSLTDLSKLQHYVPPSDLSTSLDTEYILRIIQQETAGDLVAALSAALVKLSGSYALGILTADELIAVRDPSGNRPLTIGKLGSGGFCITSETCALPNVGAEFVQDVAPGTLVRITADDFTIHRFADSHPQQCRFEAVYLSHPASTVFDEPVDEFRIKLGSVLATESPVPNADIIVPVPDSANSIALGFTQTNPTGRYRTAISRNHYIGRSFIEPTQALRDTAVARKFLFAPHAIRYSRIVLIDDSIVRGTTIGRIVKILKNLEAAEVHVRIGFPPIRYPCKYGVDTKDTSELIINHMTMEQLCTEIHADSLEFLSLDALRSLSPQPNDYCYACVTGAYWHS